MRNSMTFFSLLAATFLFLTALSDIPNEAKNPLAPFFKLNLCSLGLDPETSELNRSFVNDIHVFFFSVTSGICHTKSHALFHVFTWHFQKNTWRISLLNNLSNYRTGIVCIFYIFSRFLYIFYKKYILKFIIYVL